MASTKQARDVPKGKRLKKSYARLWEHGTQHVDADQFQHSFTSKQLKVKLKANNVAGLQLADLVAHPSRNEILYSEKLLGRELPPFGKRVIEILQSKYDRNNSRVFGKKFL